MLHKIWISTELLPRSQNRYWSKLNKLQDCAWLEVRKDKILPTWPVSFFLINCINIYTIISMYDSSLFEIISSASKLRVLKVLCEYNSYLSMRQIESFSGLAIRSVQLAVRALAQDKIIVVVKKDKKIKRFFTCLIAPTILQRFLKKYLL